jgi:hypothetical protein
MHAAPDYLNPDLPARLERVRMPVVDATAAALAVAGAQRFLDRQGAVHARVSVDFAREFGCLLEAPLGGVS